MLRSFPSAATIGALSELLARDGIGQDVPVHGMLCFVEGDWPLLGGSLTVEGLDVRWPKKARRIITAPGTLSDDRLRELHRILASEFPPALKAVMTRTSKRDLTATRGHLARGLEARPTVLLHARVN